MEFSSIEKEFLFQDNLLCILLFFILFFVLNLIREVEFHGTKIKISLVITQRKKEHNHLYET